MPKNGYQQKRVILAIPHDLFFNRAVYRHWPWIQFQAPLQPVLEGAYWTPDWRSKVSFIPWRSAQKMWTV